MKPKLLERARARQLRSQGFSIKEITKKLKVSKGSVSSWVKGIELTETQKERLKEKERQAGRNTAKKRQSYWHQYRLEHPKAIKESKQLRFVENFFNKWSPNMAYILGYFAADGTMFKNKNGSCYIAFTSTDIELIMLVKNILSVTNKIESYQPKGNSKIRYNLQIGGKGLFNKLKYLGLTPKKSLKLKLPQVPNYLLNHFIRGYFDGDGCAYLKKFYRSDRSKYCWSFQATFISGSGHFLGSVQSKLRKLIGIKGGSLYFHDGAYRLHYSGKDVVKLFKFMYPSERLPLLKRKWRILRKGVSIMGS